ncbi:MAG: phospholipid carrier-dependent glycosyltransferase [Planctomycetota bacterium]
MQVGAPAYYLLRGLVLPVMTVSDAPIYHLFFALRWWQAGWIEFVPTPFGELAASYFPANGDLWLTWLVIGEQGATLAKVGQWPFAVLGGVVIYGLGRQCGAGRSAAMVPAVLWLTTFLVLFSAALANVDLLFAYSYLSAIYFWCQFQRERAAGNAGWDALLLASLAAGLTIGTKSVGLAFVGILFLFTLPSWWRGPGRVTKLVILCIGGAIPTTFWFVRNIVFTGNPVYPLDIRILGIEWFPGWYAPAAMKQSGYHLPPSDWRILLDRLSVVVDLRILWLWALSLLVGGFYLFAKKGKSSSRNFAPWLAGLAVSQLLLFWYVLPYNTQERFLLPALGCGIVPLSLAIKRRAWLQYAVLLVVGWHLATPSWTTNLFGGVPGEGVTLLPLFQEPLSQGSVAVALSLPAGIALASLLAWTRNRWAMLGSAAVILGAFFFTSSPVRAMLAKQREFAFYPAADFGLKLLPAWLSLEKATSDKSAVIAYSGTNLPYYLFGSQLQNHVYYVDIEGRADWHPSMDHWDRRKEGLFDTASNPWPDWHRERPNLEKWLACLDQLGVEFLFIARENRHAREEMNQGIAPFPIELNWADPATGSIRTPSLAMPSNSPGPMSFESKIPEKRLAASSHVTARKTMPWPGLPCVLAPQATERWAGRYVARVIRKVRASESRPGRLSVSASRITRRP